MMPQRKIKTMYFHISQNNSGGKFYENEKHGIGPNVIIEGANASDAYSRLEAMDGEVTGMYDNCPCCGERWYKPDDDEGTTEPRVYGEKVEDVIADLYRRDCFIHHYDGKIEHVVFNTKESQR
jgi:hypothetical protein